jgi:hypothetical protein
MSTDRAPAIVVASPVKLPARNSPCTPVCRQADLFDGKGRGADPALHDGWGRVHLCPVRPQR